MCQILGAVIMASNFVSRAANLEERDESITSSPESNVSLFYQPYKEEKQNLPYFGRSTAILLDRLTIL